MRVMRSVALTLSNRQWQKWFSPVLQLMMTNYADL